MLVRLKSAMLLCGSLGVVVLALTVSTASAGGPYLFSSFRGNGEDGLHLAYSYNGHQWTPVRNDESLLTPTVGERLMRDPSIVRGPEGVYHMVWTSGWEDIGFGYSSSTDLIHWAPQHFFDVSNRIPDAKCAGAPEVFYDESQRRYQIVWQTSKTSPKTGGVWDSRLYYTTTKDFTTFSPPQMLFDPGYNSIDGSILKVGDRYALLFKNESETILKVSMSDSATGPFGIPTTIATGTNGVEGPSGIKIGDSYYVYFDHYPAPAYYGAVKTSDFSTWTNVSGQMAFPSGFRHGTVFEVPQSVLNNMIGNPAPAGSLTPQP
jgi:hypothetical protein